MKIARAARIASLCGLVGAAASCQPGERLEGPTPVTVPRPTPAPTGAPAAPAARPALPRNNPDVRIGISIDTVATTIGSPGEYNVQSVSGQVLARMQPGVDLRFTTGANGRITGSVAGSAI